MYRMPTAAGNASGRQDRTAARGESMIPAKTDGGLLPECGREELLDLLLVDRLAAGRDRARGLAARVKRVLALVVLRLVRGGHDARADVCPRAVVQGLLLAPEDVRVRVFVEMGRELWRECQGLVRNITLGEYVRGRRGTVRPAQVC